MSKQLTYWFNIKQYHPVKPGVYQLLRAQGGIVWSYWNGEHWKAYDSTKAKACKVKSKSYAIAWGLVIAWRGLAVKP